MCADQPAVREHANIAGASSGGTSARLARAEGGGACVFAIKKGMVITPSITSDILESITRADGTLAWTPAGRSARSLTVRHNVPLECPHIENYALLAFNFGLYAADPTW